MKKDRVFCLKIYVNDKTYRFSTDKISIPEQISGSPVEVNYLPYIISLSINESSISYDGSWSVPSVNITVWDGFRTIASIFEFNDYEKARAEILYTEDDGTTVVENFAGYVTGVSFEDAKLSFSVRVDDEVNISDLITIFNFDTFQKSQVFSPSTISVTPYFEVNEQTPWSFYAIETRRLITAFSFGPRDQYVRRNIPDWYEEAKWVDDFRGFNVGDPEGDDDINKSVTLVNKSMQIKKYAYNADTDTFTEGYRAVPKVYQIARTDGGYMLATDVCTKKEVYLGFDRSYYPKWSSLVSAGIASESNPYDFSFQYAFNVLSSHEVFAFTSMNNDEDDQDRWRVKFPTWYILTNAEQYGATDAIKFNHRAGTALIYYGRPDEHQNINLSMDNYDYVWVKCNGMKPSDIDSDADITNSKHRFGFIYAGQNGILKNVEERENVAPGDTPDDEIVSDGSDEENPDRYKVKLFHRYEIVAIRKPNDNTGVKTHFYLMLRLHSRGFDPYRHVHAPPRGGAFDIASYEFPDWVKEGDPIKFVNMKWSVEYMDYNLSGLTSDEVLEIQTALLYDGSQGLNRLKNLRVDMIKNISDYVIQSQDSATASRESNDRIINNASGKFALTLSSKTFEEEGLIKERVEFGSRSTQNYRVSFEQRIPTASGVKETPIPIVNQFSRTTALVYPMTYSSSSLGLSTNYMLASDKDIKDSYFYSVADFGRKAALDFFRSNHYRIIHDPIPENSSDIGSGIPIVYGIARRVPMIQAVSNKVIAEKNITAGDDIYLYASHPCNVINPSDIVIELLDSEGKTPEEVLGGDRSQLLDEVVNSIIVSPFPKYLDDHYDIIETAERESDLDGFKTVTEFDGPKRLYNPYYYLVSPITNYGQTMYGVKLRGSDWQSEAGAQDRRYAIRNGVGSSKLYASFSGWTDEYGKYTGGSGSLISHPLDIIRHFNDYYGGTTPYGKAKFNDENINFIKSRTSHYTASVVINEPTTVYELIKSMNQQFGFHSYYKNGAIYFAIIDGNFVNYENPISDSFNLLKGIKQDSIGYKDLYNEVRYNYGKNWLNSKYDYSLVLNSSNNRYCAQAEKLFGGKKQFKVDCNYLNSSGVAGEVANRMARILSCRKSEYSLSVRPMEGIEFEPGMFVPLTCSHLGLDNQPVLILSVKETESVAELKVVHLVDF